MKKKVDRRKKYVLCIDTETISVKNPLPFDIGGVIIDTKGKIYEYFSFLVENVWNTQKMKGCWHSDQQLRLYSVKEETNLTQTAPIEYIQSYMLRLINDYHCPPVCGHNIKYDIRALNKSVNGDFFPNGVTFWDSLRLARTLLNVNRQYKKFCEKWNFLTKAGKPRADLQTVARWLKCDNTFKESHEAISDSILCAEFITSYMKKYGRKETEKFLKINI